MTEQFEDRIKDLIKGIRRKRYRKNVGYVYAPYVMAQSITVTISVIPKIASRYAINTVDSKYYTNIKI